MSEQPEIGGSLFSQLNNAIRNGVGDVADLIGEVVSGDAVEFSPTEEGSVFLLVGQRGRAVFDHAGALVGAGPGASFDDTVTINESCMFVGVRFNGQVVIEDVKVTAMFIGCIFRTEDSPMVQLPSPVGAVEARANFSGCRFGPRAPSTGNVIDNPGAPGSVNIAASTNVTGLALGTVTQFGVTS